jgi:hypothetical protein
MRRPKGFGKNYFSLSAICAYSSATVLHAQCTSLTHTSRNYNAETLDEEEELLEDLDILDSSFVQEKSSSCHCNCFFKRRLYTLKQFFKFFPQTFFIFNKNRTGISPPYLCPTLILI